MIKYGFGDESWKEVKAMKGDKIYLKFHIPKKEKKSGVPVSFGAKKDATNILFSGKKYNPFKG